MSRTFPLVIKASSGRLEWSSADMFQVIITNRSERDTVLFAIPTAHTGLPVTRRFIPMSS